MNKEELIKEFDERQKALRDEFIAKLEDDKKEFELIYPEDDTKLYYFNSDYEIDYLYFYEDNQYIVERYKKGACFETKEEAEQHLKERKLLFKLKQWAKRKNEGWEPDWKDVFQEKYYIIYDYYRKRLYFSFNNSTGTINKLPYFKTREIAQECIELFGDEIKEVLL